MEKLKIKAKSKINKFNNNKNNEKNHEDNLLVSFNFISNPHYFPETGLDINKFDFLGLKYNLTLINPLKILPGGISLNSEKQINNIAKNIFENFNKYKNKKKLNPYNILTLSQRIKRSLDIGIYNNTDLNENDFLEKTSKENLITYYIPKIYDKQIFPVHFQFNEKICPKIANDFKQHLNLETIKNTYNSLLKDIPLIHNKENKKKFEIFENNFLKISLNLEKNNSNDKNDFSSDYTRNDLKFNSYLNFIEIINYFEVTKKNENESESNLRKKNLLAMLNEKKPVKGFDFLDKDEILSKKKLKFFRSIIKKYKEILEVINFDLFYIKNYSDDFIKIYASEIFKFTMNVVYTYISPTQDEINKNLRNIVLTNFFIKDYQIAGIYRILMKLNKELDSTSNILKTKDLPQISYGSVLTMNVLKKKDNLDEKNIINNFYVEILFDFKIIKTLSVTDLLNIIANYININPTFLTNLCLKN